MNTDNKKMIGVVGGMGPYAGLDLVKKIFDQTTAKCDQDHLPVSMISVSHSIPDRTEFLLGNSEDNPALAISEVIHALYDQGATVIGIPCNTAHAPQIFNELVNRIPKEIKLIHMINEVASYIKERYPSIVRVGILSTKGTADSNIYPDCFSKHGLNGIQVSEEIQKYRINPAIYDKVFGIKAKSNPVSSQAKKYLYTGIKYLVGEGVEAIVLGCTEIPLGLTDSEIQETPIIDSSKILARTLILESSPEDLEE